MIFLNIITILLERIAHEREVASAYMYETINYLDRNDLVGDNLEALCIEIHKPSSAPFIVGTIYWPTSSSVDSFANIEQLIQSINPIAYLVT
jgi:hypothetical protein